MDKIVRFYITEANPQGAYLPGVPLHDLTQAEYDALPAWLQASVDAAPYFTAEAPSEEK